MDFSKKFEGKFGHENKNRRSLIREIRYSGVSLIAIILLYLQVIFCPKRAFNVNFVPLTASNLMQNATCYYANTTVYRLSLVTLIRSLVLTCLHSWHVGPSGGSVLQAGLRGR